jgi:hypothetical protein
MSEFLRLLWEIVASVTPFRIVHQWESGLYLVCGRLWYVAGPGVKIFAPKLCDVVLISHAERTEQTGLQFCELTDGTVLTYAASFRMRIVDAWAAYSKLEDWRHTSVENAAAALSDAIAEAEPDRFSPAYGKRERLKKEFVETANDRLQRDGVELIEVNFTSFARVPVFHLVGEHLAKTTA